MDLQPHLHISAFMYTSIDFHTPEDPYLDGMHTPAPAKRLFVTSIYLLHIELLLLVPSFACGVATGHEQEAKS